MNEERELAKKLNAEIIAFEKGKILIKDPKAEIKDEITSERSLLLISFSEELKRFGFVLSSSVLKSITTEEIKKSYQSLIPYMIEKYHEGEDFKPVYPHFPEQVISKTEAELWSDQNKLYDGKEIVVDNWYSDKEKKEIVSGRKTILEPINEEDFNKIPQQIMKSNNSLTIRVKAELLWFLENKNVDIPERIPFKETLCLVLSTGRKIKNLEINDVLRFAFYVMGTDPSLPKTEEKRDKLKLKRSDRRMLCEMIDEVVNRKGLANSIVDAKLFYSHWNLLSERLHPGEYSKYFKHCLEFFTTLKDNKERKKYKTWQSQVQKMYDEKKDLKDITEKISERPGELVRRFDSLVRRAIKNNEEGDVMDVFIDTKGMKNKTLLELSDYYDRRDKLKRYFTKADGTKKELEKLEPLKEEMVKIIEDVISRKILKNIRDRITTKDLEGKTVYIDPEIKRIPIPKRMRNQTIEIPVGTKFKIPEDKNCIRFFVHWIDEGNGGSPVGFSGVEDLDLHAYLYNKSTGATENVGWNTTFNKDSIVVHSGDVRMRKGKCAEYVDVDLEKTSKKFDYLISDVYNYQARPLNSLECWLGYCYRDKLENSDSLWYPKEVEQMMKITSQSTGIAAFLVDLKNREITLINCNISGVVNNQNSQKEIIDYFTAEIKSTFNSYSVLKESYQARGAKIIDKMPVSDDPDYKEEDILQVTLNDIAKDYTKILEAIGE